MTINRHDEKDNLLVALHKWARHQDENFTTEAFAHLLRNWIHKQPKAAIAVLRKITGPSSNLTDADCAVIRVILQRRRDGNQPDIRIESRDAKKLRIIIEVKVRQHVDWSQIREYRNELGQCARPCLTLLTRDRVEQNGHPEAVLVDSYVLWHQVAEYIQEELANDNMRGSASDHLGEQLLGFLRQRGMTMEKVSSHLVQGVSSLDSLMKMLEEAVPSKRSSGVRWECGSVGLYWRSPKLTVKDWHYWCGIDGNGRVLIFQAYYLNQAPLANVSGWGLKTEGKNDVWYYELDLTSDSDNFFDLPVGEQKDRIKRFIQEKILLVEGIRDASASRA